MKRHQRKCRCCKKWFAADPRNHHHQRFCLKIKCRKASKAASQKRWQSKPTNQKHWCGPDEVERVRAWRNIAPLFHDRSKANLSPRLGCQRCQFLLLLPKPDDDRVGYDGTAYDGCG